MLTCGASGAPLFSLSVRVTAGYRGEGRGDNKRDNAHRQKEKALLEKTPTALFILRFVACRQTVSAELPRVAPSRPNWSELARIHLLSSDAPLCSGFPYAGWRWQSGHRHDGVYPAYGLARGATRAHPTARASRVARGFYDGFYGPRTSSHSSGSADRMSSMHLWHGVSWAQRSARRHIVVVRGEGHAMHALVCAARSDRRDCQ